MEAKRKIDVVRRLSRVEGQIRGIQRMVQEDKYCVEVMVQVAAARAALRQVGLVILDGHTRGCVVQAVAEGRSGEAADELLDVIEKFLR